LRLLVFPLGRRLPYPADSLGHEIAALLLTPSEARDRLTAGIHTNADSADRAGRVEHAFQQAIAVEPVEHKLRAAGMKPPHYGYDDAWLDAAVAKGAIDAQEAAQYRNAQQAVSEAIRVDDFPAGDAEPHTTQRPQRISYLP
jgi:acyl-CoA dehydrogenase